MVLIGVRRDIVRRVPMNTATLSVLMDDKVLLVSARESTAAVAS